MIFAMIEAEFGGAERKSATAPDAVNLLVRAAVQRALAAYSWGLTEPAVDGVSEASASGRLQGLGRRGREVTA
jgi:hypothetical protein